MPRPRQRIVTCDCFDCKEEDPVLGGDAAEGIGSSAANEAAARQEPPPKSLLIVASGFLQPGEDGGGALSSLECAFLPHLGKCARQGSVNLIACRPKAAGQGAARAEIEELLGLADVAAGSGDPGSAAQQRTLQARFKGMEAAMVTNDPSLCDVAAAAGVSSSLLTSGTGSGASGVGHGIALPAAEQVAQQLLQQLALDTQDAGIDLLLLAVDLEQAMLQAAAAAAAAPADGTATAADNAAAAAAAAADGAAAAGAAAQAAEAGPTRGQASGRLRASVAALHWLDELVMQLNKARLFREAVLLGVLATPQGAALAGEPLLRPGGASINPRAVIAAAPGVSAPPAPRQQQQQQQQQQGPPDVGGVRRPAQSFEHLEGAPLAADLAAPMLLARRLPGVIRRDGVGAFSLQEAAQRVGQGALLVDRILPEVAYKLGRALKYGA